MIFKVRVTEVRRVPRTYWVEAEDQEGALEKAASGDTVAESGSYRFEVGDRFPEEATPDQDPFGEDGKEKRR